MKRLRVHSSIVALIVLVCAAACQAAPAKPGQGIHYVYFIRHGMYDPVRDVDDRVGNALNALGHEQARLVGARLAALPSKPTSLVSSDFTRARETADDIGQVLGVTPQRDSLIHECTPTSVRADYMANHSVEEIALCDSNLAAAWRKYMTATPDADSIDVLVAHGNVIRWFVTNALGMESKRWHTMEIGNGSLTILSVRPDGTTRLVMFSDVGHLPLAKQTWTGKGPGWLTPAKR